MGVEMHSMNLRVLCGAILSACRGPCVGIWIRLAFQDLTAYHTMCVREP